MTRDDDPEQPPHDSAPRDDAEDTDTDTDTEAGSESSSPSTPLTPDDEDETPLGDTDQHSDA